MIISILKPWDFQWYQINIFYHNGFVKGNISKFDLDIIRPVVFGKKGLFIFTYSLFEVSESEPVLLRPIRIFSLLKTILVEFCFSCFLFFYLRKNFALKLWTLTNRWRTVNFCAERYRRVICIIFMNKMIYIILTLKRVS